MNRAQAADALARSTAFWSQLLAESEAEAALRSEEVQQLRAALAQAESIIAAGRRGDEEKNAHMNQERAEHRARIIALEEKLREAAAAGSRDPAVPDFDTLRAEMQHAWAREDRSRSDVVTDVLHALRERGLLRA